MAFSTSHLIKKKPYERDKRMTAVIQRVSRSAVKVDGKTVGSIGTGLTILLGIFKGDKSEDVDTLVNKLVNLRIFADDAGKMNLSVQEISGAALVISQFTLAGNTKRGRRPSFDTAMPPREAETLYALFCQKLSRHIPVQTGVFGATMEVEILNDGPVTFILDSGALSK